MQYIFLTHNETKSVPKITRCETRSVHFEINDVYGKCCTRYIYLVVRYTVSRRRSV